MRFYIRKYSIASALFVFASILNFAFPSFGLYPIYIVPLCYIATNCSRLIAILLAIATSTITVSLALPNQSLANVRIDIIIVRAIMMLSVIYLYINYHITVSASRKRIKALQSMLPTCKKCGSIMCPDSKWRTVPPLVTYLQNQKFSVIEFCLQQTCNQILSRYK